MSGSALLLTIALNSLDYADDHESEDRDRGQGVENREGKNDIRHDKHSFFTPVPPAIAERVIALSIIASASNMELILADFKVSALPTASRNCFHASIRNE